jgi:hypothetical protein
MLVARRPKEARHQFSRSPVVNNALHPKLLLKSPFCNSVKTSSLYPLMMRIPVEARS